MQVTVEAIRSVGPQVLVDFKCGVGAGVGLWKDAGTPRVGQQLTVELDLALPLALNENTERINVPTSAELRRIDPARNELVGLVEAVDDDRVAYLRLAPDCLIMVDLADDTLASGAWCKVGVNAEDLLIWPVGT